MWRAVVLLGVLAIGACVHAPARRDALPRITPEQAGYSAERLDALRLFLESSESDSLLLLHDGKVFFEWGDIHKKILVHSMRKALLNSLYGIYRARGAIDLERPSFYHTGVGVHMLGVYPKHGLVLVHRVDTERAFRFNDGDLYQLIKLVHGARLKVSRFYGRTTRRRGSEIAGSPLTSR